MNTSDLPDKGHGNPVPSLSKSYESKYTQKDVVKPCISNKNDFHCSRTQHMSMYSRVHANCTSSKSHISVSSDGDLAARHLKDMSHSTVHLNSDRVGHRSNLVQLTSRDVNHCEDKTKSDVTVARLNSSLSAGHFRNNPQIKPLIKKELRVVLKPLESLREIAKSNIKKRKRSTCYEKTDEDANKSFGMQSKHDLRQIINEEIVSGTNTVVTNEVTPNASSILINVNKNVEKNYHYLATSDSLSELYNGKETTVKRFPSENCNDSAMELNTDKTMNDSSLTNMIKDSENAATRRKSSLINTTWAFDICEEAMTKILKSSGGINCFTRTSCEQQSCKVSKTDSSTDTLPKHTRTNLKRCRSAEYNIVKSLIDCIKDVVDNCADNFICGEECVHNSTGSIKKHPENKPTDGVEEKLLPCFDATVKVCFNFNEGNDNCNFSNMQKVGEASFSFMSDMAHASSAPDDVACELKDETRHTISMDSIAQASELDHTAVEFNAKFNLLDSVANTDSTLKASQTMEFDPKMNLADDNIGRDRKSALQTPQTLELTNTLPLSADSTPRASWPKKAKATINLSAGNSAPTTNHVPIVNQELDTNSKLILSSDNVTSLQDCMQNTFSTGETATNELEIKMPLTNCELKHPVISCLRAYRISKNCTSASQKDFAMSVSKPNIPDQKCSLPLDPITNCVQETTVQDLDAKDLRAAENCAGKLEMLTSVANINTVPNPSINVGTFAAGSDCTYGHKVTSIHSPGANVPFQLDAHPEYNFVLCHFCGSTLPTERELDVHLKMHHYIMNGYLCHMCGYFTTSCEDACQHEANHDGEKEPVPYLCSLCGHMSLFADETVEHCESHFSVYLCDTCGLQCSKNE